MNPITNRATIKRCGVLVSIYCEDNQHADEVHGWLEGMSVDDEMPVTGQSSPRSEPVSADELKAAIYSAAGCEVPLRIREGAFYERLDGDIVGPANPHGIDYYKEEWKWRMGNSGPVYRDNGTVDPDGRESMADLRREVDFACVPEVAEKSPQFKVGDWVVCQRAGRTILQDGKCYCVESAEDRFVTIGHAEYDQDRFRLARPDEIPQPAPTRTTAEAEQRWVVELECDVWLAPWTGDPGRTIKRENAKEFDSFEKASDALDEARKYRPFVNAVIWEAKQVDDNPTLVAEPCTQLQLREGAYYLRRDGEIIGPMQPTGFNSKWKWGVKQGSTFTDDGKWSEAGDGKYDLIREVPPPVEPDSEGWIEWKGGECPLDGRIVVEVMLRRSNGTSCS